MVNVRIVGPLARAGSDAKDGDYLRYDGASGLWMPDTTVATRLSTLEQLGAAQPDALLYGENLSSIPRYMATATAGMGGPSSWWVVLAVARISFRATAMRFTISSLGIGPGSFAVWLYDAGPAGANRNAMKLLTGTNANASFVTAIASDKDASLTTPVNIVAGRVYAATFYIGNGFTTGPSFASAPYIGALGQLNPGNQDKLVSAYKQMPATPTPDPLSFVNTPAKTWIPLGYTPWWALA